MVGLGDVGRLASTTGGDDRFHSGEVDIVGAPVASVSKNTPDTALLTSVAQIPFRHCDERFKRWGIVGVVGHLCSDDELILGGDGLRPDLRP